MKTKLILSGSILFLFILLAFGSEDSKEDKDKKVVTKAEDNFCNNEFYSREATIFGSTGRKEVLFYKNEYNKNINEVIVQDGQKSSGGSFLPSNRSEGTWKWADSLKRTIIVKMIKGNNMDCSGTWTFSNDYSSLTIPPSEVMLFKYESSN
jgi:hypothetical protein